jgi:hypothetical protein
MDNEKDLELGNYQINVSDPTIQPTEAKEQGDDWVRGEDGLPETGQLVILANDIDKWVVAGELNKFGAWFNQFQDATTDTQIYPTHWRKLPSPPQQ